METTNKPTIVCIPGLGGHKSAFDRYEKSFPEFEMRFFNLINRFETEREISRFVGEKKEVIFLCNCYGAQIALRVIKEKPELTHSLIVVEPFFSEMFFWRRMAFVANKIILAFMKFTDFLHIKRKKFSKIDYSVVERHPIFFQPFFDIMHQSMTEYFGKIDDILSFKLPQKIETKTLFMFSKNSFTKSKKKREYMQSIFINSETIEIEGDTHNIVNLSRDSIADTIRGWLYELNNN